MEYLNIQEATALIGKSPRTIRGRVANLSPTNRHKYIRRGKKNSLLISKRWLTDTFKKGKKQENDTELYERLLQEKDKQIDDLKANQEVLIQEHERQYKIMERQINITNSYLASKDKNFRKLIENSTKQIESPIKDKKGNWLSRLLNKKII